MAPMGRAALTQEATQALGLAAGLAVVRVLGPMQPTIQAFSVVAGARDPCLPRALQALA